MIACLDWSGSGEGSMAGAGAGKKGGRAPKGSKSGKSKQKAGSTTGMQAMGMQAMGMQAMGMQATGMQATGMQATGIQATGMQATGMQSTGLDTTGPTATGDAELAPPMFLIAPGAPALEQHRPAFDDAKVQSVFAQKRAAREERIAALVADAVKAGKPAERIVAAIVHDSEHAPHSTNRRQLAEIGVACPPPGPIALSDADATATLWRVIYGLAHLGIFLTGTNHLDDRALLRILCSRILEEEIRDVPPSRDMSEFIDLTPCRAELPDGLEGPFDDNGDDLDEVDDPVGPGLRPRGAVERDALLPRPRRDAM